MYDDEDNLEISIDGLLDSLSSHLEAKIDYEKARKEAIERNMRRDATWEESAWVDKTRAIVEINLKGYIQQQVLEVLEDKNNE